MGRIAAKTTPTDTSWIKFGEGSYLCSEHKMQFKTVAASQAHSRTAHPEKLWTMVARGEWINDRYSSKIVNTSDMGGGIELWIGGQLWDTGYKSFEHARDCFVDMVARGEVNSTQPVYGPGYGRDSAVLAEHRAALAADRAKFIANGGIEGVRPARRTSK
jgi:hypothetical protein